MFDLPSGMICPIYGPKKTFAKCNFSFYGKIQTDVEGRLQLSGNLLITQYVQVFHTHCLIHPLEVGYPICRLRQ